jgi:hypothetical protein
MKKIFLTVTILIFAAMTMNAQSITWNISGANPAQYKSITADELWYMFENNQLAGNQKYKVVIPGQGYLAESSTTIALLAILACASAGTEPSSKHLFFKDLPGPGGEGGKKMEVYFSQGVLFEDLENTANVQVKIPVIPVDGYRVDLFDNPVGCRTSLAKCSAFCSFYKEFVR